MAAHGVATGRTLQRNTKFCEGCNARLTVGEPKLGDDSAWWQHLNLTTYQRDNLLLGAAEYEELCNACYRCHHGPHGDAWCNQPIDDDKRCACFEYLPNGDNGAINFVDWVSPTALRNEPEDAA